MLQFKYEPWNPKVDLLLHQAGSPVGYAVLQSGMKVRTPSPMTEQAVDGVVGLLAEALEWLRWYGMSPEQVNSKVNHAIRESREKPGYQARKATEKSHDDIADGHNWKGRLDPHKPIR